METLPPEIILKISHCLRFKDKLNLALTCRRVDDLISRASLHQDLNLFKYGKRPHKIVNMFENNPFDGSQVRTLSIKLPQIPEQLRSQLSTVFSNVSRITVGNNGDSTACVNLEKNYEMKPPLTIWIKTLQIYDIYTDWSEVLHALRFNVFPHLLQLKLGLYYVNIERGNGFDPFYFAPVVQNAPYLSKLTFCDCDINLELLEHVHNSCPHITTLRLEHVSVVINTPMPQNINPSNNILKLEVYDTANFDRNGLFNEYILQKYKNLHYLVMDFDIQDYSIDSKLSQYFPEFYDNSDDEQVFNSASNQVISKLRYDFISGVSMYRSASTTFFSSLPKTIKTLKMDIKSINGALEILGNSDMNLTELDFCDPYLYRNILMKPHQLKHVYKLTSLKTLKIPINSSIQERYRDTIISSTITNLVITCQNGLLYIDWVLEKFCCLQDLYIKHSKCSIRDSGLAQKVYPKLQSLAIRKCTIYPELLPYLKRVAPDMKNLKLDNIAIVSESKQRVYHIDISDFHLQRFHILLSYVGLSKKLKFYSQFIIQANNKELVHGSFGDIVSVIQNKDTLGKIDYITAIKDIHEKVDALEIGDS